MTTDPRYPIGRHTKVPVLSAPDRALAIAAIAELPSALRSAVEGLTDEQLDTPYRDEGWTVRQVVHHVADSHMNALVRFKWALTESNPTIKAYDERAWAELPDSRLAVGPALRLIEALHGRWTALLGAMAPEAFATPYQHPVSGPFTLDMALGMYAWHGRHHTAHVTELRKRRGW